ncbi:P2X purinoceptor 1 [Chanos chanos]|uniref:P2X purinoceptor n=1 Tax=Chanos chanos TaxID=29144 RepID=A0A6J2WXB1_CHACN|nr:P2X purinoceptor 1 [Chanos chanos]
MKNMKNIITEGIADFFCEYETPRQVLVRNRRIGITCRIIQLGVLAYIIGWVFIYEKGYQSVDTAIGSVFTKMKGIGITNQNGEEQVWDVADYVFPEQGDSSFVVMTNFIMTKGQTKGKCPELLDKQERCESDADCDEGKFKRTGNGHMTGKCFNETGACEVFSWCPIEDDRNVPDPALLLSAENYTLFVKNAITFPQFKVVRSNLVEGVDKNYLRTCLHDPVKAPLCPIFKLGDIVRFSGFDFAEVAREGGAIGILMDWECNLDLDVRHCKPKYEFYGLYGSADKTKSKSEQPSVGYNFRYAKFYMENGTEKRTLMKVFGIRIEIIVHGLARKFDIIPTLTAIGSGVGIFGVATVVCDLVLLHLLPKRDFYKNMKFKYTMVDNKSSFQQAVISEHKVAAESNWSRLRAPR